MLCHWATPYLGDACSCCFAFSFKHSTLACNTLSSFLGCLNILFLIMFPVERGGNALEWGSSWLQQDGQIVKSSPLGQYPPRSKIAFLFQASQLAAFKGQPILYFGTDNWDSLF